MKHEILNRNCWTPPWTPLLFTATPTHHNVVCIQCTPTVKLWQEANHGNLWLQPIIIKPITLLESSWMFEFFVLMFIISAAFLLKLINI